MDPSRRDFLRASAGAIGGLVVGAAIGWLAKPVTLGEATVTTTVTKTVSVPAKPSEIVSASIVMPAFPPHMMLIMKMERDGILSGFGELYGYEIEARVVDEDVPAFVGRVADVGMPSSIELARIREEGLNAVVFGKFLAGVGHIFVRGDSKYTSVEDLLGKRFGIPGFDSGFVQAFQMLLREQGIVLERDFEIVQAGWGALWELLLRGDVEAMINDLTVDPERVGKGEVVPLTEAYALEWEKIKGHKPPVNVWATFSDWLEVNEGAAKAILLSAEEVIRDIRSDPQGFLDAYVPKVYEGGLTRAGKDALWDEYMEPGLYLTQRIDQDWIRKEKEWLERAIELGLIKAEPLEGMFKVIKAP